MLLTNEEFSIEQVLEALENYIARYEEVQDAAKALGITRSYLWKVRNGKTPPPESILEHLGFMQERKIIRIYRKVTNAPVH